MSASVHIKLNMRGVLNYANLGRESKREVTKAIRASLNVGRTQARREIASQFVRRTGALNRQARRMQTKTSVTSDTVAGKVTPLPRLLNIFERGATLARGRGILRPRPVVAPASKDMTADAIVRLGNVIHGIGK
jgi:hypothetical protein